MPDTIKASERQLNDIFSDAYVFEIPEYQRPYAWTTEHVDELLDDLLHAMRRDNGETPYFLGSVVIIKGDDAKSQVVDGQQRLTTLTMLLCSLRELAEGKSQTDLDRRIRQQADTYAETKEIVRFSLRPADQSFFYQNVQADGGIRNVLDNVPKTETDSQERVLENIKYIHKKLADLSMDNRKQLAFYILRRCYLVMVSTPDIASAYRIFSVMNDRGLNLSPTDILKPEVVGGIDNADERRACADKWEDIEKELGRDDFGRLFVHIRMIYAKTKQRKSLHAEFREHVLKDHNSKEFIETVLDRYDDAFKSVLGMSDGAIGDIPAVNACLKHLRRLDNADWIPPAMAFFHRRPHDREGLAGFTKDLERLAYGMFIRRANVNERIRRYADVLRDIDRGDDVRRDDGPLQLRADEKSAILDILDGPIYPLPRVPLPLLLRLDGLVADPGAEYNYKVMTIEHVLPQNPPAESRWRGWFPDDAERERWVHRLANLALLSFRRNSGASNLEFERKKKEYFQKGGATPFALTTQVASESEWTPAVLERRQRDLVKKLEVEWRLA